MIDVLTKKCAYDDWAHERSPHKHTHFVCFLRIAFMIMIAVLSKTHLVCVLYLGYDSDRIPQKTHCVSVFTGV